MIIFLFLITGDPPIAPEVAHVYSTNRALYEANVREWIR
jgi:ubiquitin-protein ligase